MVINKLLLHYLTVILFYSSTCMASGGCFTLLTKDGIKKCKAEYSKKTFEQLDDIIKSEYTVIDQKNIALDILIAKDTNETLQVIERYKNWLSTNIIHSFCWQSAFRADLIIKESKLLYKTNEHRIEYLSKFLNTNDYSLVRSAAAELETIGTVQAREKLIENESDERPCIKVCRLNLDIKNKPLQEQIDIVLETVREDINCSKEKALLVAQRQIFSDITNHSQKLLLGIAKEIYKLRHKKSELTPEEYEYLQFLIESYNHNVNYLKEIIGRCVTFTNICNTMNLPQN